MEITRLIHGDSFTKLFAFAAGGSEKGSHLWSVLVDDDEVVHVVMYGHQSFFGVYIEVVHALLQGDELGDERFCIGPGSWSVCNFYVTYRQPNAQVAHASSFCQEYFLAHQVNKF